MDAKSRYDVISQERDKLIPEVLNESASARSRFFELEAELKDLIKELLAQNKSRKKPMP